MTVLPSLRRRNTENYIFDFIKKYSPPWFQLWIFEAAVSVYLGVFSLKFLKVEIKERLPDVVFSWDYEEDEAE